MRCFVTGGAGYIGSAVAAELLAQGHEVTVYDSLVTGHRAAVPSGATFVRGELLDQEALSAALGKKKYDAVLHFAAFIEAGESMLNPGKYFRNNLEASAQLIEAVHRADIKRFVLSSTAALYQTSEEALQEDSPLGPQNTYGHTKLMIEQVLASYLQIYGLRYAALRYFNAAGALPDRGEAHQPESHLIPLTLRVALGQRESVAIFGSDYPTPDGTCIRDYIHIADLVSAHLLALTRLDKDDQLVYNIGSGHGYSVLEVIEMARRVSGHPIPSIETPRRVGDPARLVASPARIQQELGWSARHSSLEEIITTAWEWHRKHPNGYAENK
ncbi:MAG TPA: UDP-glucose 4-epimerase GalE [Anaerolineales bacterium]|nr:UDP-glucose 4-epimerase GalE [Anaerolineales bacterium]HLE73679.1 UDP-glucose 4-epimerase GalE [Anaerolineales bacterium]